jgi:hypothetical protein
MFFYPKRSAFRAGYVSNSLWDDGSIGDYSVAFGSTPRASGTASAAFGFETIATGNFSAAFGNASFAQGNYSTAMGYNTRANGIYSTAGGNAAIANGESSVAFGKSNQVDGSFAGAFGEGTNAYSYSAFAVGRFNVGNGTNTWVTTDPIFEIGNGSSSGFRSNAVTVLKNGKVAIQGSAPNVALDMRTATDAVALPRGDDGQRPSTALIGGLIRYNTVSNTFEGLSGSSLSWKSFAMASSGSATFGSTITGTDAGTSMTGQRNSVYGYQAMMNTNSGENSVAVGYFASRGNTNGSRNVSVGNEALMNNSTGSDNTAIGYMVLRDGSGGSYNTGVGSNALFNAAGQSNNTAVGYWALRDSGSQNTAVGFEAGRNSSGYTNSTSIGYQAQANASNQVRLGNGSITSITGQVAFTATSDRRHKHDVQDSTYGLDFISKLRPVTYKMNDGNGKLDMGFIAQEVEAALGGVEANLVATAENEEKTKSLRHADLIALLVKSVQELKAGQDKAVEALRSEFRNQLAIACLIAAMIGFGGGLAWRRGRR